MMKSILNNYIFWEYLKHNVENVYYYVEGKSENI